MRHVGILNLFISSILPTSVIPRKSISPCLACGKFQLTSFTTKRHYAALPALQSKYAHLPSAARPAEPSIAINKLSRQGRASEALSIYLRLLHDGGFPSRESLYQLIRSLYKSNHLVGMYAVHDTLLSYYSVQPPSKRSVRSLMYMYTMMIHLVSKHSQPVNMNTIRTLCKEMDSFGRPNIVLYNTLIQILLEQNQLDAAKAMLQDLTLRQLKPTIVTYNIFIKDAARKKDVPRLMNYLEDMQQQEIEPDHAIVSIVVTTLCDLQEYDQARLMVETLHGMIEADFLVGKKYKLQLLRTIESRRKKNRKYVS